MLRALSFSSQEEKPVSAGATGADSRSRSIRHEMSVSETPFSLTDLCPCFARTPYDFRVAPSPNLPLDESSLTPGLRLAVGVSVGADSVALLRALHSRRESRGLVLHVAHLHHGLRGSEAAVDLAFVRALAARLELPFHHEQMDVGSAAREAKESIEEAARRVRYGWFDSLMAAGEVDAVATAHTRNDQAETVCAKILRGAWTEGLSGIYPSVEMPHGRVLRLLLGTTRVQVEDYLRAIGQDWRNDSSNHDVAFTRNRIRHQLVPLLEGWNPRIQEHFAQMAELAREEEDWWQAELAGVAPQIVMQGKPVRGGGRSAGEGLALDAQRLRALHPALQRRLLRHAACQLGISLDFPSTEAIRHLASEGRAGQKRELPQGLRAERTPRELRLTVSPVQATSAGAAASYALTIPGEIEAKAFGIRLKIEVSDYSPVSGDQTGQPRTANLRNWKPGDRVCLRYSSGPHKVKEVLERLRITGSARTCWPVLEVAEKIIWMKGVELEPETGISVSVTGLEAEPAPAHSSGIEVPHSRDSDASEAG